MISFSAIIIKDKEEKYYGTCDYAWLQWQDGTCISYTSAKEDAEVEIVAGVDAYTGSCK